MLIIITSFICKMQNSNVSACAVFVCSPFKKKAKPRIYYTSIAVNPRKKHTWHRNITALAYTLEAEGSWGEDDGQQVGQMVTDSCRKWRKQKRHTETGTHTWSATRIHRTRERAQGTQSVSRQTPRHKEEQAREAMFLPPPIKDGVRAPSVEDSPWDRRTPRRPVFSSSFRGGGGRAWENKGLFSQPTRPAPSSPGSPLYGAASSNLRARGRRRGPLGKHDTAQKHAGRSGPGRRRGPGGGADGTRRSRLRSARCVPSLRSVYTRLSSAGRVRADVHADTGGALHKAGLPSQPDKRIKGFAKYIVKPGTAIFISVHVPYLDGVRVQLFGWRPVRTKNDNYDYNDSDERVHTYER